MSEATPSPALAVLIDAPMMAWGSSSRFTYRETEAFPTKSGLLGLLAAAVGIDKDDPEEATALAPFSALRFSVFRLPRTLGNPTRRLSDFHTVGGGFDARISAYEKLSIPPKASGGPSANAVITRRAYLTDARFIAVFQGERDTLEKAAAALLDPVWGVWFGRKTCIPAMPLSPVVAGSPREAIAGLLQRLGKEAAEVDLLEGLTEAEGPGTWYQADQPVSFGRHHGPVPEGYLSRPVRRLVPGELP